MKTQLISHKEISSEGLLNVREKTATPSWLKSCDINYAGNNVEVTLSIDGLMNNCYQIIPNGSKLNLMAGLYRKDTESDTPSFQSVSTSIELGTAVEPECRLINGINGRVVVLMKRKK